MQYLIEVGMYMYYLFFFVYFKQGPGLFVNNKDV